MKKILFVGIIVGLLVVSGLFFYLTQTRKALTVEQIVPSEAMFYVHVFEPGRVLTDFSQTELVKKIRAVEFKKVLIELKASQEEIDLYDQITRQIFSRMNQEIFSSLFSREFAVAFYMDNSSEETDSRKFIKFLSQILLVTRIKPEAKFIEVLTAAVSKFSDEVTETTKEYLGETVHVLHLKGALPSIAYVRFGEILALGAGDTAVKRAIEVVKGKTISIDHDPAFLEGKKSFLPQATVQGYFQYGLFMTKIKDAVLALTEKNDKINQKILEQMETMMKGVQGFETFIFSNQVDQVVHGRIDTIFKLDKMSEDLKQIYQFSPADNASLSFVPREAIIYYWNSLLSLESYWKVLKKEFSLPSSEDGESSPTTVFGLNLDEVVSMLSNQFGAYLTGFEITDLAPLPQAVFFLNTKNEEGLREKIKGFISNQGLLRIEQEEYQGINIEYIAGIPLIPSQLKPAYCFFKNHFFAATNPALLRQALDAETSQSLLRNSQVFSRDEYGFTVPMNNIFFVEIDRLVTEVMQLFQWANGWADVQYARRKAFKEGAKKRLEDILKEIDTKKAEVVEFEKQMDSDRQSMESLTVSPETVRKTDAELERQRKLEITFTNSIKALQEEKRQLSEAREARRLTTDGQKRLEEIEDNMLKREEQYGKLRSEIDGLEARRSELSGKTELKGELELKINKGEEKVMAMRQELRALEDKETELDHMIEEYSKKDLLTPEERKVILGNLVNPLLEAFTEMEWAGSWTKMMEDRIRSEFFLKVK
ncbi:MAG: hypothetical protein AB1650_08900 [Candidatus Omnitrophota bacterium]